MSALFLCEQLERPFFTAKLIHESVVNLLKAYSVNEALLEVLPQLGDRPSCGLEVALSFELLRSCAGVVLKAVRLLLFKHFLQFCQHGWIQKIIVEFLGVGGCQGLQVIVKGTQRPIFFACEIRYTLLYIGVQESPRAYFCHNQLIQVIDVGVRVGVGHHALHFCFLEDCFSLG